MVLFSTMSILNPKAITFDGGGVWPETDPGKRWVWIDDVKFVKESPNRLPVRFANELYRSGESGMGYTIFKVVFSDGLGRSSGQAVLLISSSIPGKNSGRCRRGASA